MASFIIIQKLSSFNRTAGHWNIRWSTKRETRLARTPSWLLYSLVMTRQFYLYRLSFSMWVAHLICIRGQHILMFSGDLHKTTELYLQHTNWAAGQFATSVKNMHSLELIRYWLVRPGWSTSWIAQAKIAANVSRLVNTFWKAKHSEALAQFWQFIFNHIN